MPLMLPLLLPLKLINSRSGADYILDALLMEEEKISRTKHNPRMGKQIGQKSVMFGKHGITVFERLFVPLCRDAARLKFGENQMCVRGYLRFF